MSTQGTAVVTVDALLASARAQLNRLTPAETLKAQQRGAILVDIRSDGQRGKDGVIAGSLVIQRNVLEWRLDPSSPHRDPSLAKVGKQVILICNEGYQSSLAAATLRQFGLDATDVIGGAQAWRAAGLPLQPANPIGA